MVPSETEAMEIALDRLREAAAARIQDAAIAEGEHVFDAVEERAEASHYQ